MRFLGLIRKPGFVNGVDPKEVEEKMEKCFRDIANLIANIDKKPVKFMQYATAKKIGQTCKWCPQVALCRKKSKEKFYRAHPLSYQKPKD